MHINNSAVLCFSLLSIAILLGCGQPTIDASNEASLESSIAEVRKSVSEDEKEAFDEALGLVTFSDLSMKDIMSEGLTPGSSGFRARVKEALEGKTASEIINMGEQIRLEREAREREQALAEIKELEERRLASESAKGQLALFEVERSRY